VFNRLSKNHLISAARSSIQSFNLPTQTSTHCPVFAHRPTSVDMYYEYKSHDAKISSFYEIFTGCSVQHVSPGPAQTAGCRLGDSIAIAVTMAALLLQPSCTEHSDWLSHSAHRHDIILRGFTDQFFLRTILRV